MTDIDKREENGEETPVEPVSAPASNLAPTPEETAAPSPEAAPEPTADAAPEPVADAAPEPVEDAAPEAAGEPDAAEATEEEAVVDAGPNYEDESKQWYIIHTYSGFENKVKESLRQRADAYGMGDKIGEVLVPTEDVVEVRDGKKYTVKKKFFPGYVLVQMEMSDEAWHVVRSTPKVTGFVGGGQRPLPMTQDEVDRILSHVHVTKDKPKPKFDYRLGETVKITDGPFSNFTGVVEEINEDRSTLKVMVSIFGRATPVELEFHQVTRPD